jgi:hypothetical protein
VDEVTGNGTGGGEFINFNQNYNVSNVDQVYLPVAMSPVRKPADVGYMGTTLTVKAFRQKLTNFTTDADGKRIWPVYNNPVQGGKRRYPNAGIRVPSTQTVFNFYMDPYPFGGTDIPQIIPARPPQLIQGLMDQWTRCTTGQGTNCPEANVYEALQKTFTQSYRRYLNICSKVPSYLKPVEQDPPRPSLVAFLTYVYGWVPFNFACANDPLPTADQPPAGSRVPIDYMAIQYNYEQQLPRTQWFNPYTRLIHDTIGANAYAFSIDDHSSFLSNSGGSTPGGLVFAVGGPNGLPNATQAPPPVPSFYKYFDFSVNLGAPAAGAPYWLRYGICKNNADTRFPGAKTDGYGIGIDPTLETFPCTITLVDSNKRKYQLVIKKANAPPQAIWPRFSAAGGKNFDPAVMSCPAVSGEGAVGPGQWCIYTNERADPTETPGVYSISTRAPLAGPPPQD